MPNQSLARIMYGTSEDYHASTVTSASAFSAPSSQSAAENSHQSVVELESLVELLHKAWTNLSGKR